MFYVFQERLILKKKKDQKTIAKTVHAILALSGFRVVNCFALSVVKCIKQK